MIVFAPIAEKPFTFAPPLRAAMYKASSNARFLEISIFPSINIALPVASTYLNLLSFSSANTLRLNIESNINTIIPSTFNFNDLFF